MAKVIILALLLSGCARDKALHIITSIGLTKASYIYYAHNTNQSNNQAEAMSFITALGIGFIKEFIDKKFNWSDIGADLTGAGIGALSQ